MERYYQPEIECASQDQIRELQKTSSSFFILYSESITARVPRLLSSRTEGKPDFPL